MKISVPDYKILRKSKDKWNIAFLIIGILGFCIFQGYYSNQFILDDGYLTERFATMINGYGIFGTIFRLFLNTDLASGGELRFYGLSKVIHVIIYLLAGEHPEAYQFIMTGAHFASGILLYKILLLFNFDKVTNFMCVCAWWFSPFAHVQCFHHFSYLFLPLYFVMGYIYYNLKRNILQISGSTNGFLNGLLLFCCMFTGENTIPLLEMVILVFIIWGGINRRREIVRKYLEHLSLTVILGISWILLWKNMICAVDGGRFSDPKFSLSKINLVGSNFRENLKYFLWLGDYRYGGNWKSGFRFLNIFIVLICLVIIMYTTYWRMKSSTEKVQDKLPISKFLIGSFFCFIGMTIIYVLLNIFKGYEMSWHYFYTIFTVVLCIIVILINYIPDMSIRKVFNLGVILVLLGYNVFWSGVLLPQYAKRNGEVEKYLERICNQYDTIIAVTEEGSPLFGKVIQSGYYYRPQSAFSAGWVTEDYLHKFFENVICVPSNISIGYDQETVYLDSEMTNRALIHFGGKMLESITVDREKTCFMYLDYKNDWRISNFNEFIIEGASKVFSKNEIADNYDIVFSRQFMYLSAEEERLTNGETVITVVGGNLTEQKSSKACFQYNRNSYGVGEFYYDFSNIPIHKNLMLFMDFEDLWSRNPGERVFDINVEFNGEIITLEGIDVYDLGENEPVRLAVKLPYGIRNMRVRLSERENSDVAMIQAIGLLSE